MTRDSYMVTGDFIPYTGKASMFGGCLQGGKIYNVLTIIHRNWCVYGFERQERAVAMILGAKPLK